MSVCWIQMISPLIICTVSLLCTAGEAWTTVHQTPGLLVERGHSAQMDCWHNKYSNWYDAYWFQQLPGESMKLIVHTVPFKQPDFGNFSQDKYSANKTVDESGSFTVKHVEPGDNGVYFCFVTVGHSDADTCQAAPKLHQSQEGFHYFLSEKLGDMCMWFHNVVIVVYVMFPIPATLLQPRKIVSQEF